jgi:hypothetical protein
VIPQFFLPLSCLIIVLPPLKIILILLLLFSRHNRPIECYGASSFENFWVDVNHYIIFLNIHSDLLLSAIVFFISIIIFLKYFMIERHFVEQMLKHSSSQGFKMSLLAEMFISYLSISLAAGSASLRPSNLCESCIYCLNLGE